MSGRAVAILVVAILVGVAATGIWYVTVYDTAAGRCSRGDLGACAVLAVQHPGQETLAPAVWTQRRPEQLSLQYGEGCLFGLAAQDTVVYVGGSGAIKKCTTLMDQHLGGRSDWRAEDGDQTLYSGRVICSADYGNLAIEVLDTGAAVIGEAVCRDIGLR